MSVDKVNRLLEAALADLEPGDEGAIRRLTEALRGLGVEVGGDTIAVGDISDAAGIAIGRNIRRVITQVALPAELETRLEGVLDQLSRRAPALSLERPVRVFLASPSDVADERALALKVFDKLAYDPLLRERLRVEAVAWDKPATGTPLLATMTPQEAIKQGLPKPSECDIAIVILWSRMGTPLPVEEVKPEGFRFLPGTEWEARYLSGTEWEYVDAMQAALERGRPYVLVYRRDEEPLWGPSDPRREEKLEQWERVNAFFDHFTNPDGSIRQGYNAYRSPSDFQEQLEFHLRDLLARLLEEAQEAESLLPSAGAPAEAVPLWEGSPFPGLRPLGPEDAPIFFGRGLETDGLVARFADPAARFLVVVGASGSGKSSLVGAGLLPRLAGGAVEGSRDWAVVRFTPDELGASDPFASLAAALQREPLRISEKGLAARLKEDPGALVELCSAALPEDVPWAEVVLFIDQFEELFTRARAEDREAFVAMLDRAARSEVLRTVLTLRADLSHRCLEHPKLAALVNEGIYNLAAPQRDGLREMIERPAERAGLSLEPGLVKRILDHTGDEPGRLALMAFALEQLYEARRDGRLTLSAYEAFGGVEGAIGEQARAAFESLDPEAQGALPQAFGALIEIDREGVPTRRRSELPDVAKGEAAGRLVEALTEKRLLVQSRGEGDAPVVDVAHEALFASWPRLARWIEANREGLRIQRELRDAAEEWESRGRDSGYLYRGGRLEMAATWAKSHAEALTSQMQAFLNASRRRARWTRAGIAVALMLIVGLSLTSAIIQTNTARSARSRELAALVGLALQRNDLIEAHRLAVEAYRTSPTLQSERALYAVVLRSFPKAVLSGHTDGVRSAAFSPDGKRVVTRSSDGTARIWHAETGDPLNVLLGHTGEVRSAAFSPDGTRVVTGSLDRTARVWDAETRVEIAILEGHTDSVRSAAFSPDGDRVVTGSLDGTARIWDAATGDRPVILRGHTGEVRSAAFSPDGQWVVTGSSDRTARVWDAGTGDRLRVLSGHTGEVRSAAFSPDGARVVTGSLDGTAQVWDAETGAEIATLEGHTDWVESAAFSPDGARVVTASRDGTAWIWDTASGAPLAILLGHTSGVESAAFSPDGKRVATVSRDRTARVWDVETGAEIATLEGHTDWVWSAAFSPDGKRVVTASRDRTARIWAAGTEALLRIAEERLARPGITVEPQDS